MANRKDALVAWGIGWGGGGGGERLVPMFPNICVPSITYSLILFVHENDLPQRLHEMVIMRRGFHEGGQRAGLPLTSARWSWWAGSSQMSRSSASLAASYGCGGK